MRYMKSLSLLLLLVALAFYGCGGTAGDYPGAPNPGRAIVVGPDGSISAPADTSITSLKVMLSPEYDQDAGKVNLYMLVTDQNGALLEILNKYNFVVTMDAGTGTRIVNMNGFDVTYLPVEGVTGHTVTLGMDTSGSMASVAANGKTSNQIAIEAATLYVDKMRDDDRAGIVQFSTTASVLQPVTKDKSLLYAAIDTLGADGATNIGDAILKCVDSIGVYPGRTAAVVMTDGGDTEGLIDQGIAAAKKIGLPVFTIGLGAGVDPTELIRIASETGGQYFEASTSELGVVFSEQIPDAIDKLPSRRTMNLKVPLETPLPQPYGENTVRVTATVNFKNARKTHSATASGTFVVQQ